MPSSKKRTAAAQDFYNQLGLTIRHARQAKGITMVELGKSLNLSGSSVSAIETGKTGLDAYQLAIIYEVLGSSVDIPRAAPIPPRSRPSVFSRQPPPTIICCEREALDIEGRHDPDCPRREAG